MDEIRCLDEFALRHHHGNYSYKDKRDKVKFGQDATPLELVVYICESLNPIIGDNDKILDPFAGTGIFMDTMIRYNFGFELEELKRRWDNGLLECYEIMPDVALVCAVNMELAYMANTGEYKRCNFVYCIDTLDYGEDVYRCRLSEQEFSHEEMREWFRV